MDLLTYTKNQLRRALWHVNRSPFRHTVKSTLRLTARSDIQSRRALVRSLPIDASIREAATTLNRQGWVNVDHLVSAQALAQLDSGGMLKLQRACDGNVHQDATHKFFWTRLLDEDKVQGRLHTSNPFVQYAIQLPLVSVLAHSLGEIPRLDYVLLTLSRWSNQPHALSQLWHRDHDDVRTFKVFTYLTDVSSLNDGPFTFIPGPQSDRLGFFLRSHQADASLFKRINPTCVQAILAPRRSTFIVETSRCVHMGSRIAQGHQRLLYTATYISTPRMYPEPALQFMLSGNESEIERRLLVPDHLPKKSNTPKVKAIT